MENKIGNKNFFYTIIPYENVMLTENNYLNKVKSSFSGLYVTWQCQNKLEDRCH